LPSLVENSLTWVILPKNEISTQYLSNNSIVVFSRIDVFEKGYLNWFFECVDTSLRSFQKEDIQFKLGNFLSVINLLILAFDTFKIFENYRYCCDARY